MDPITAPMRDNDTWARCLHCGREWQVQAKPGILMVFPNRCYRCEDVMQTSGTFPALNEPRKPTKKTGGKKR